MAPVGDTDTGVAAGRRPARLLLYLATVGDPHRLAVGPALAALAERTGLAFECHHDARRRGRHFGGGDPRRAPEGLPMGSPPAGGGHPEQVLWLATRYEILAVGDPASTLWPVLASAGARALARTADPAEVYGAVLTELDVAWDGTVLVLDGAPQGDHDAILAPYAYPAFFTGAPTIGVDVGCDAGLRARLEALGARRFVALGADRGRAGAFPGSLEPDEAPLGAGEGYAQWTARLARRHAGFGRGILLGDPELVAAQLPKARRLRLLPLYGQPQSAVLDAVPELVSAAREPVFGRQWDDRDFFTLARLGHGLQVVDPSPPFDAGHAVAGAVDVVVAEPPPEPDDAQLERWAREGRVLVTLLFWAGMLRELDCVTRLLDLVADTGVHGGLVITAETAEHAGRQRLSLLGTPVAQGGARGRLEPLLGSTGRGVAAEADLPAGRLAASLAEATQAIARVLPSELRPRGWWPLLDAALVNHRPSRIEVREGRPTIAYTPRDGEGAAPAGAAPRRGDVAIAPPAGAQPIRGRRDARGLVGAAVRASPLARAFEPRRPFDAQRPGPLDPAVAEAVAGAGLGHMWTKAGFGSPRAAWRRGDFVALPFTAGNWDGWSPFYTLSSATDLRRAERRLLRAGAPGWLASTIDSPLWALPGEQWERGGALHEIAVLAARGGSTGRLVPATPGTVARYARVIERSPAS